MSELAKGKIPPAPNIRINEDYIKEMSHVSNFTPGKAYKVKRTAIRENERRYMVVDNYGRYIIISPRHCELVNNDPKRF